MKVAVLLETVAVWAVAAIFLPPEPPEPKLACPITE